MRKILTFTYVALLMLFAGCSGKHNHDHAHLHGAEGHENHMHSDSMGEDYDDDDHDHLDELHSHDEDMHAQNEDEHSHDEDGHNEKGKEDKHHEGEVTINDQLYSRIKTEKVEYQDFSQVIVTSGEILPTTKGETIVTAPFAGTVSISSNMYMGGQVKASETLFVISTNVGETSDMVERASIELEAARREYERDYKLSEEQIVSKKELNECREKYEQAKMKYQNLANKISGGKAYAKSSISGYVKELYVSDGSYVNAGDPLAVITQSDKLILRVKMPLRYHRKTTNIKNVRFRTAYGAKIYSLDQMNGQQISLGVNTASGGYFIPLRFEFNNIEGVMSGTSAECYVLTNEKKKVITVPNSALAEDQGVAQVFVKKHNNVFKKQFVTLGATDGVRTEVLEGLMPGDEVATSFVERIHLAASATVIPAHSHSH